MASESKTYSLKIEKLIPQTPSQVFRAISEGRLFMNCGADQEALKIDFRVGGKYTLNFLNYGVKNCGEFLEIVPNQKIIFTWCQDYENNPTPDTKVVVELKDAEGKTALTLIHSGFVDTENCEGHRGGWTSGLDDLTAEMVMGKLSLVRKIEMPLDALYHLCKSTSAFTGIPAELKLGESSINEKLVYACNPGNSKLSLILEADDEPTASWIKIVHEDLLIETDLKKYRSVWDQWWKKLGK